MPDARPPRGRHWAVAVLGLLILMLGWAVVSLIDGTHPSGYLGAHMDRAAWTYPMADIQFYLGLMTAEFALSVLLLVARTRTSIGVRAAFLGVMYFCGVVVLVPLAMHAPSPILDHIAWLFFASVFLVLFAIASGIIAYVHERRARALGMS
jgi:hypothetical protein